MSDSSGIILPPDLTFEQAVQQLEHIVEVLETDTSNLEDALKAHAEGVALARFCLERLHQAELRVQELALE